MPTKDTRPAWLKTVQPFAVGGLAGCVATSCVQPIDMVKVRIQLAGESGGSKNPIVVAKDIISKNGFRYLYKGLDAGIVRQLTYTTARLGIFRVTSNALQTPGEKTLPLYKKAFAGLFAGAAGALVGNPADLALIRMQADATLPVAERRNYTGVFDAMAKTVKEDGVLGLWRGAAPTVVRAMALNLGMLASYDQAKESLEASWGKGYAATFAASAISGFFAVTFSLPFDFIKTRVQKQRPDPKTGELPYKNMVHAAGKVLKSEGPLAFYAGYPTYYVRIAPHAMITLLSLDAINGLVTKAYTKNV
eukprot:GDKH01005197.1.p1 GENE.GDKH01005197.1~~GDKH01005197.1.p1  ORF type:complete len:305 (+),score=98.62 GDKH01005197.1:153-1067(+)